MPQVKLTSEDNQRLFELDVKLKLSDASAILYALEGPQKSLYSGLIE